VEKYPDVAITGVMDGADVASYDSVNRVKLQGVQQWFRRVWMVTHFANLATVAGLPQGEKGKQKAMAAMLLKFMIEGRLLSSEECSRDNGSSTPNATRGVFKWLLNTAQAVYPVDSAYRTPAACRHTSAISGLTEAAFQTMVNAAFADRRGPVDLTGIVGTALKNIFDAWSVKADAGASFATFPVRTWASKSEDRTVTNCVDVLRFSGGTIKLMQSTFLRLDTAGAASNYTTRSGVFIDPAMWSLAYAEKPTNVDLTDDGGGPRGYAHATVGLKGLNPLGQLVVESSS